MFVSNIADRLINFEKFAEPTQSVISPIFKNRNTNEIGSLTGSQFQVREVCCENLENGFKVP